MMQQQEPYLAKASRKPYPIKEGQESVWDYPRPPRLEPTSKHVRIVFNGVTIADTQSSLRILETSHPPVYYLPTSNIRMEFFKLTTQHTFCEWKGTASYYTIQVGSLVADSVAWTYPNPDPRYLQLRDHFAFYPSRMEACYVNDEEVQAQDGDFYGGWITSEIVGPFKGGPGTWGW